MALPSLGKSNGEDREPKNSQGKLPEIELPSTGLPGLGSSLPPTEHKKNTFDSEKDFDSEEFKPVSVDEALYKEDDVQENKEIYDESDNIDSSASLDLPSVETTDKDLLKEGSDYNPDYKEDLEKEKESKFVDKKKKKIIPTGGKKSKRDKKKFVRASDFDERKNKLAKTKVIQFLILSVIFIMFLVGLKNTFFPAHVYTDEQIRQFGAEGAGETGFPKERGRAFVESYISTYLTVDKDREDYNEVLGHFYGVDTYDRKSNSSNFKHSSDVAQYVIIQPKVFNIELMTDYSAQYKVSAFVSDSSGKEAEGEEEEADAFRLSDIGKILSTKGWWYIAILCVLFYSAVFPFLKYATDLMVNKFGVREDLAGMIPMLLPFGNILLTPLFGGIYDKKGKGATIMIIGSLLLIFVHVMFAIPGLDSWILAMALMIVLGIGFSLVPSAMWPSVPKIIPENRLGTAYALIFYVQNWGLMGVPLLIGWVLERYCITGQVVRDGLTVNTYDYTLPMIIFASFGVMALVFAFLLKAEDKKKGYGLQKPNIAAEEA